MANFAEAFRVLALHEGPLENDPRDPGGVTCCGVTIGLLRELGAQGDIDRDGDIDAADVIALAPDWNDPEGKAAQAWGLALWDNFGYWRIPVQKLATKLLDLSAPLGWPASHKILQRALTHIGYKLVDDGRLGPRSWAALMRCIAEGRDADLLAAWRGEAMKYFDRILERNPKMEWARKGWMRRAAW